MMVPLFMVSILLGAGLLFLVQPMIAKQILPLLGGSSAVWTTCMLFFQTGLLGGYLYAHALTRLSSRRVQLLVHAAVLIVAALVLPVGLQAGAEPGTAGSPVFWLLLTLIGSVGLPFFVLSSAGPLLQAWFAGTQHRSAKDPYFLYAASNAGSMLALLGYPLLVEPSFSLSTQRDSWSIGYGVFAVLAVACGYAATRGSARTAVRPDARPTDEPSTSARTRVLWVLLAFVPSSLMLGATQHLTTDVASFPLLWVFPLAIYLATFIVVFSRWGRVPVALARSVLPVVVLLLGVLLLTDTRSSIAPQVIAHLVGLLVVGLACHGRLAAERPDARRLTEYYLWLSVGGMLGGVFNSLLAPMLFDSIVEYPLVLVIACLMGRLSGARDRRPRQFVLAPLLVIAVFIAAPRVVHRLGIEGSLWDLSSSNLAKAALPAAVCLMFVRSRMTFALAVAALLVAPRLGMFTKQQVLHTERTFFGVHRVLEERDGSGSWHNLWHGTTLHGSQYDQAPWTTMPTTYYAKTGPVGDIMKVLADRGGERRVGLVGLGIGTLAAYGREEWALTYYEIDPEVVRIATDTNLYTYLSDSESEIDIVVGDARLKMASEPTAAFDLIAVDAFSSDAIPVHLITREAVALYLDKLDPDGLLVFHVTNLHLNLVPVLAGIAQELDLEVISRFDGDVTEREVIDRKYKSEWMVLSRDASALGRLVTDERWWSPQATEGLRVWTDDYSNVLQVLK